jgi:flagellar motor switch protein FliN/FliY
MANEDRITPEEIDALLKGASASSGPFEVPGQMPTTSPPPNSPQVSSSARPGEPAADSPRLADDIQLLFAQAEQAIASVDAPRPANPENVVKFTFKDLTGSPPSAEQATIELLRDVELEIKIELGRTEMYLEDVLKLRRGAVVPLNKLAGDPVDIYANGRLIARGEVLVLNDNFCVRVGELVAGDDVDQ